MIGQEALVKMRIGGKRPSAVFIDDFQSSAAKDWSNPGARYGETWEPDHATIQIDSSDNIEALDLRCVTGLLVVVSGSTESRAKALFNSCKRHSAQMIVATHDIHIGEHRIQPGWMEIHNG